MSTPHQDAFVAVSAVLSEYFDGLYHSDTQRLRRVFHPRAVYATAVPGDGPLILSMDEYFPIVDRRPAPAAKGQARTDRVLSIEFAGPVTAVAKLECSIAPRHFIDVLTLVFAQGRWQVISKVFHYEER